MPRARRGAPYISIHALREEGDVFWEKFYRTLPYFYPRPPRGGRPPALGVRSFSSLFLSTPSARRATLLPIPRSTFVPISIHALREEGDFQVSHFNSPLLYFYPRPPRGGRPDALDVEHRPERISIHALREEGDL